MDDGIGSGAFEGMTASELAAAIRRRESHLRSHGAYVAKLQAAAARAATPVYGQTQAEFERGRDESHHAMVNAEDVAIREVEGVRKDWVAIDRRRRTPARLALTPAQEREAAGVLPLARAKVAAASTAEVAADLAAALQTGEASIVGAHVIAAQERLAGLQTDEGRRLPDGRTRLPDRAAEAECTRLLDAAKAKYRDRSLDALEGPLDALSAAMSDLGGLISRRRWEADLAAKVAAGEIVPWPDRAGVGGRR
jgi:hypothetical protein